MQLRARIGSCVVALAAILAAVAPAFAASGGVNVSWYAQAVVKVALTPNYASGFGTVKAQFGTQPTPAPGSGACLNGCAVDFGNVLAGTNYLYKYAVHLNVQSNDTNGVRLYGQGAADFYNTNDGTSQALNTSVYWLQSTNGSISDANTGFSPSFPFDNASSTPGAVVTGNSFATAPSIAYTSGYPASSIATSSSANSDLYYDYQLKVPGAATSGQYYVWIVYTVVAI